MDELREIHRIRQRGGEPRRRWFTGHDLDVFTWQGVDGELMGFQVTYDNPAREKAISWKVGEAIRFSNVLTGGPTSGGHPGTPLLTASQHNGRFVENCFVGVGGWRMCSCRASVGF